MTVNYSDEKSRLGELCKSMPIVDTHNDFPYLLRVQLHNEIENDNKFTFDGHLQCHTDLIKMRRGKLGVQFFSCYIECKDDDPLYQDFNKPNSAVRDTMEQIDIVRRLVDKYPNHLEYVTNSEDSLKAYHSGKIAITMGVEGLHQVDTSLGVLRRYHELGVRYITLTHNCDNPFATAASSVVGGLPDNGLTDYGKKCVEEMNRLGLIVDLSHVSYKTMVDTLAITKSPVIFSHSSAFTITPNERNVRDDILMKVKENNGVVCVNFFPAFITRNRDNSATIDDAVAHILHIVNVCGWDHVGFGSDFDGIPEGPKGLEDISKYPDLLCKIMNETDATDTQIQSLMGGNVMRVWRENEVIAKSLQENGAKVIDLNWDNRVWDFFSYCKDFPEIYEGSFETKENVFKDTQGLFLTPNIKKP